MKRCIYLLIFLCSVFVNLQFLSADCEGIMDEIDNVKIYKITRIPKYDELEGEGYDSDFFIGLRIEGLKNEIYAEVSNDYDYETIKVKYADTNNGVYEISSPYIYKSVNFTVRFLSSDSSCPSSSSFRTVQIDTDVFNTYHYYRKCREYPNLEVCKPTTDTSEYNEKTFDKLFEKEKEKSEKTVMDIVKMFLSKYYLFILIPLFLISIMFVVRVVIIKRVKKDEI